METDISQLVQKHLSLLQLEREESLQFFFKNLSPATLYHLEQTGQALSKLTVNNVANVGAERYEIKFEHANGLPLEHGLSIGDLVICIRSKDKGQSLKAIITEIDENNIGISSKDQFEQIEEEEKFSVIKTDTDITYKNQKRALENLMKVQFYSCQYLAIIRILFEINKEVSRELLIEECIILETQSTEKWKFSNACLAEDQRKAVQFALKRKYFSIIQGPPGTGKTTTLVELIIQLHRLGKKILVCAPTNVAVDNLVIRLGETEAKPLRLGHPSRIMKSALKYSFDAYVERDDGYKILREIKKSIKDIEMNINSENIKNRYKETRELKKEYRVRMKRLTCDILKKCPIILCTLNSASSSDGQLQYLPKDYFDVLIVDEASQALEASMWIAIPNAPKLVLAGDINQLPPVVKCQEAVNKGLNISLMERAIKRLGDESYVRLSKQYRMNQKIMLWSSKSFYDNTLIADDSVKNHLLKDIPSVKETALTNEALIFIDTCGCECEEFRTTIEASSKGNPGEAVLVKKVVASLIEAGLPHKDIGIITPYALQVDFIRRSFSSKSLNVEVSTVDGFQGREKEVIVLSLVRSNQEGELGFVTDFRRLNVAVTRARRLLIVIADSETMEKNKLISSLLKRVEEDGLLQTAEEYFSIDTLEEIQEIEKGTKKGTKYNSKMKTEGGKTNEKVSAEQKKIESDKGKWISRDYKELRAAAKLAGKGGASSCINRKQYNVFEAIAMDEHDDPENALEEIATTSKNNAREKKSKSNTEKCREKSENKTEEDDFDKIVSEFTKSNYVCAMAGCSKSTKLIKLVCEFCKSWFCIEHGMQEIHGCGDAIRRKEQKDFRHRKPEPATFRDKQKFAQKMKKLEDTRKPKKKSTK